MFWDYFLKDGIVSSQCRAHLARKFLPEGGAIGDIGEEKGMHKDWNLCTNPWVYSGSN